MNRLSAKSCFALFDGDDGCALLFSDYRRSIHFDGNGDLASVFAAIEAASADREWIVVAADYALGSCFETVLQSSSHGRPRLRAWVFGKVIQLGAEGVKDFLNKRLSALSEHDRVAGIAEFAAKMDAQGHSSRVEQIRRWIADGDCYQINLTFPLEFRIYGHPLALYAGLRDRQPVRYGAYVATSEETLLSFSPELFFERIGNQITTRPMKGTAPRGVTPEEDEEQRRSLLASQKERAENIMIVDLLRNDLGRLAAPGKVQVESLCRAEAYPTLWQVVSSISADVPGASLFDLFRALFPCGSITGAPKIRAMQLINDLEATPRGLYTGALGWLAPGGNCRFNVSIRTLEVEPGGRALLGVGSGIVIDSDPAREYAECLLKSRFLTGFDPGFELIETMRLEAGQYRFMAQHLERLEASANALGFACNIPEISAALAKQADGRAKTAWRVRLTLQHGGDFRISIDPIIAVKRPTHVVLAEERLDAEDYLLRHKTTARSRYDRVLANLAKRPDVFDAIFLNTRGEVCEGARSNVFVQRDGMLLTPPLACGVLPGVMRRHLIVSEQAVESLLTKEDLLGAQAIFMANALRGLIPVTLQA